MSRTSREINRFERFANAWYDQRMNESGLERAQYQQALQNLRRAEAQRQAVARGVKAAMGGANNSVDGTSVAKGYADVAAQADRDPRSIDNTYVNLKKGISDRRLKQYDDEAEQIKQAGDNLSYLAGGMFGSLYSGIKKRRAKKAKEENTEEFAQK